jgi:hypothetical protein
VAPQKQKAEQKQIPELQESSGISLLSFDGKKTIPFLYPGTPWAKTTLPLPYFKGITAF